MGCLLFSGHEGDRFLIRWMTYLQPTDIDIFAKILSLLARDSSQVFIVSFAVAVWDVTQG